MNDLVLEVLYKNTLTCPECGSHQTVEMLSLESARIYECETCNEIIQSNEDECCVNCQYGEVKCPSQQVKWN
ncbi:MAG: transposase [Flavobacteriales bacterium]|nr:transposase [Flavobacteriales bacterium]